MDIGHVGGRGGVHRRAQSRHRGCEDASDNQAKRASRDMEADVPWQDGVRIVYTHAQLRGMHLEENIYSRAHKEKEQGGRHTQEGVGIDTLTCLFLGACGQVPLHDSLVSPVGG